MANSESASELRERLDQLTTQFRLEFESTNRRSLEDYLTSNPDIAESLLESLLPIELEMRRKADEKPNLANYLLRFSDQESLITSVWAPNPRDLRQSETTQPDSQLPERIGRYMIEESLGQGGFGVVYRARDTQLGRLVALKVPRAERFKSQQDVDYFVAEARAAARLKHPALVTVHDVRSEAGRPYIVQEYVEGRSLAEWLKDNQPSFLRIAELFIAIAEALGYAHQQGLTHCDLKLANVLMDANGAPHVADFGLAVHESEQSHRRGMSFGTPAMMAPEQVRGEGHRLDGRTDIWAAGIMLYEVLTGRRPFVGSTRDELFDNVLTLDPKPPRQIDRSIPRELERICLKCVSKRRTERYNTVDDMRDDMQTWLISEASTGVPSEKVSRNNTLLQSAEPDSLVSSADSSSHPPTIIPKGLRSFDTDDADFFLDLLPGPRDRFGLPESIRFWKQRIEELDPDKTFAVGLIYGPSGCGKSSLVKAGLLPRLAEHVIAIFVEATCEDTEVRLLRQLKKHLPQLSAEFDLPAACAELRRGNVIRNAKVVLVVDQFEQWLHSHPDLAASQLVAALRHCEGENLQALLLIRDDFYLSVNLLFQELEIPLAEGRNQSLVDLFNLKHAEKVLTAFGMAYGVLGEKLTEANQQFLTNAVKGLATANKVISVRLALFADMFQGRPWEPASLATIGGVSGVGVQFLEEKLDASTAPPSYRVHEQAIREILLALLPASGTDIKGAMRSETELREAAGYSEKGKSFVDLIRILNDELRLITPTDPQGVSQDGQVTSTGKASTRYYQLTHDYLVPALREWLARKQCETKEGRAQLVLRDRTSVWTAKPENRSLPTFVEWLRIGCLTDREKWGTNEQEMMRRARSVHAIRGTSAGLILALLTLSGLQANKMFVEKQADAEALRLVNGLINADTAKINESLEDLNSYRRWANPKLKLEFQHASERSDAQLHIALAMMPNDETKRNLIKQRILELPAAKFIPVRDLFKPYSSSYLDEFWAIALDRSASPAIRFRAAAALAGWAPEDLRWQDKQLCDFIADYLVSVFPSDLVPWRDALRSVRHHTISPLAAIYRDSEQSEQRLRLATETLRDYASNDLDVLCDLLLEGKPEQFVKIFDQVATFGDAAIARLHKESAEVPIYRWMDPPLDPAWQTPEKRTQESLTRAHGILSDRFAICQTMPLVEFANVNASLVNCGYRPIRLRPYADGPSTLVAAVWHRDGRPSRVELSMSRDELLARDEELRRQGFTPLDVASFRTTDGGVMAGVWVKQRTPEEESRVYASVRDLDLENTCKNLREAGFSVPQSLQVFRGSDLKHIYSGVWSKARRSGSQSMDLTEAKLNEETSAGMIHWDLSLCLAGGPSTTHQRHLLALNTAESTLESNPDDLSALYSHAIALFHLKRDDEAFNEFGKLIQLAPQVFADAFHYRAILYARQGDSTAAKMDLRHFSERNTLEILDSYTQVIVMSNLEDEGDAIEHLEELVAQNLHDSNVLYNAACAYSVSSGDYQGKSPSKTRLYADRAIELVHKAIAAGYDDISHMDEDSDLDSIRDESDYQQLLSKHVAVHRIAAVWQESNEFVSQVTLGQSPELHLSECKRLAADGYRPVSISSVSIAGQLISGAVWHRPALLPERQRLAYRNANRVAALARLSQYDSLLPMLRVTDDPEVLTHFVHRCRAQGVTPLQLLECLRQADQRRQAMSGNLLRIENRVMYGILLALGEFPLASIPEELKAKTVAKLANWYSSDPSSCIHGASGWLLRQWQEGEIVRQVDQTPMDHDSTREWFNLVIPGASGNLYQTYVVIPPGEYPIGSNSEEPERNSDEAQNRVRLRHPVAILDREVTRREFEAAGIVQLSIDRFSPALDHPMVVQDWFESVLYCRWLTKRRGLAESDQAYPDPTMLSADEFPSYPQRKYPRDWPVNTAAEGFRLPTEAEWEIAARAGMLSPYGFGYDVALLSKYAWYQNNADRRTHLGKQLRPNFLGAFDIHGNAAEWCHDWYAAYPTSQITRDNPTLSTVGSTRVVRGGGWANVAAASRSACRVKYAPSMRVTHLGFRLAFSPSHRKDKQ